ncbi:HBL050Wp [Eremothecium sinecaudum]|uniref:CCR4-Not complex 3'-5'-exoribonuclease subunit Ccr4 n=1 Tax=Eremothecium sinecaudum TaxID=45286 RepID=A0A109UWZ3_9SACH|nr:HBL050Wp [Eremothecium sinecaudum]AMD18852.1 HBL050Wp [Eremothecium sinecaudum]
MNNPPPMGYQPAAGTTVPQMLGTPQTLAQPLHQNAPQQQQDLLNNKLQQLANQLGQQGVSNSSNPLYHPHLSDPTLVNNPIWNLQLQLAAISRQSVGQENVYARQNAMKKYLKNQFNSTQQQQPSDMAKSLVDFTKQYLLEMAADPAVPNNSSTPVPGQQTQRPHGTPVSTPSTPKAELANNSQTTPSILLQQQQKKLFQFNIDEDDEVEHRMVAPVNTKYDEQLWHTIDLSNLAVYNLNENLFKYDFLTRLYLNGNNLTHLPPSIKKLRNLRVLDISHNRLTELPPELGMCYQLKYLYFFDNMVSSLPWEFGNLFNLQFLGCEGNPLDRQLVKILAEKSVTGLIFYLRDNAPEIPLSEPRRFVEVNADGESVESYKSLNDATEHLSRDLVKKSFTLLSYNTLCQHYATPKMYRFVPSWALSWDYRREKLKEEVLNYQTDIICLQEVESKTYEEFWLPLLEKQGYSGIFHAKTRARTMQSKDAKKVDGCCIFYKNSEFTTVFTDAIDFSSVWMKHNKFQRTEDYLNRAMNKDNVALIVKLKYEHNGEYVWVVTTHLHWDPHFNDVKTFQVGVLLDYIEKLLKQQHGANNPQEKKKVPLVICGDFNSQLSSAVVELFNTGTVKAHKDIESRDFGYMSQKNYAHNLSLKSSYEVIGELPFTNLSPSFTDVIDYIWYSTQALRVRGVLGEIDPSYASRFIGLPNDKIPSDHIPLLVRFEFTKTTTGNGSSNKAA